MHQYFDRSYCIHYPNQDRREAVEREFRKTGFTPEFVFAETPWFKFHMTNMRRNPRIEFACAMSHLKAVGQSFGDERPIFFEDDVVFASNWLELLSGAIESLPDDWDVLYLGGHPREPVEKAADNLYRVGKFSCAEAYAFNNGAQRRFHAFWCDNAGKENAMYDFILGRFAAQNNAYAIYPTITTQRICVSAIAGRVDDKAHLIRSGWQNNIKG